MQKNNKMEQDASIKQNEIYYLMNFSMFSPYDVQLFCSYKEFVQSTIIELGEDWRIQSGLLSQQIVSIMSSISPAQAQSPSAQRLQFNIFNQFLLPFLKQKIGNEKQVCNASDTLIQQQYAQQLNKHFLSNAKITDSLTFKTLSLGFCIKAIDMWVKSFGQLSHNDNSQFLLTPLALLNKESEIKNSLFKVGQKSSIGTSTIRNNMSNIDLGSCQNSNSQLQWKKPKMYKEEKQRKWTLLQDLSMFKQVQMKGIQHTLTKTKCFKTTVISNFAVNIYQIKTQTKKIRILSINSQFYRDAFIVWLIFNIKLFFSITFEQYLVYFKNLKQNWSANLEVPLKRFYMIIQKQWNLLLKDYSVALHDDLQVLKSLIGRVRSSFSQIWKTKQEQIYKKLNDS